MSTLRDLLALLPHPGRRTCGLSHAIYVQILILAVLLLGRRDAAACLAVLAIIQILFIHMGTRRRERELLAELDLANTDMVTGLRTRRFVYRHIAQVPATDSVTVAFADVDNLKQVNDTWGHQTGDDYLAVVAERLFAITADGDTLVRLGGDEFALATPQTPHQLAAGLARVLKEPALIAGRPRPVRVSVGTIRVAGGDAHTALGCAEAAMRTAKRRGSVIEHYDPARDGTPPPPSQRPRLRRRDHHRAAAPPTSPHPPTPPTPKGLSTVADRIIREIDRGTRTVDGVDIGRFEVHRTDTGADLTEDGCFDTWPIDAQIADLLDTAKELWSCRGCGTSIDASQADLIVDHVRDCDRVDGAGHPVRGAR